MVMICRFSRCVLFAAALLAVGCATVPESGQSPSPPPATPAPTPAPAPVQPPPQKPQPVAVVLSRDLASYGELAGYLGEHLDRPHEIFELRKQTPAALQNSVVALQPVSVIAIGRPALEVMSGVSGIDLIHAQVFNPPDAIRGVEAMPPFEMQLGYWSRMAPHVRRIGVLGSAEMRSVIAEVEAAATALGLQLVRAEVKSDKEALVAFRRMVPQIDGFVFLPDESILSPEVIRRIIVHGSRNDCQILVYSPAMYRLGAHLYVGARQSDVAAQLITLVADPDLKKLPLTEMRTSTRQKVAAHELR